MGLGAVFYMYDVVVKSSRSLSHLLMSSCLICAKLLFAINSASQTGRRVRAAQRVISWLLFLDSS